MLRGLGIPRRSCVLPGGKAANHLRMLKNSDKSASRASVLLNLSADASREASDARTGRKTRTLYFLYLVRVAQRSASLVCRTEHRRCDARMTEARDSSAFCSKFRLRLGGSYWYTKGGYYVES